MDIAYDHIQEENFKKDEEAERKRKEGQQQEPGLNQEFQDAYKAFSASPWGVKLGGFWASARKQGEQVYASAQQELSTASATASTGFTDLLNRTRTLSTASQPTSPTLASAPSDLKDPVTGELSEKNQPEVEPHPDRPDSLPADIYKEASQTATSLASRLRAEAARRLKEAQKLEDASDEALLKWGTGLSAFLKDAVSIAPPSSEDVQAGKGEVLFASKDAEGKRVVHATRLDAQLHVIHCSLDSFLKDPASNSKDWEEWQQEFDVEAKTGDIATDLERYEQLRSAMEKVVPEMVEYEVFWKRYYFLRHVVETEEVRRRELLKGAAATSTEDQVAWDDSDDEEGNESAATPKTNQAGTKDTSVTPTSATAVKKEKDDSDNATLKPATEPRKSNDLNSSAGSDTSYDIVSGATSRTPGSPTAEAKKSATEDSDDEDWE